MTRQALPLRHAVALGLLQGPTELLPVSSSAHTTLLPWLAGRDHATLDPTLRKSFEVALHLGTAAALLSRPPWAPHTRGPGLAFLAAAVIPPAAAGYALGGHIERRLGTPATIAAGLLAGSAAIGMAELTARTRDAPARAAHSAGLRDGLAVGVAQALALIPGVSRSGASLAAARARGFSGEDADLLSWQAGMSVLAGAALLQGLRLARSRPPARTTISLAAGAACAFASTRRSVASLTPRRRSRSLLACAGYRVALAALVVRRRRIAAASNAAPIPKEKAILT